jgi:hypothetical protein
MTLDTLSLQQNFAAPPREFGAIPFWFWNDDLDEAEVLRQLREFHANGFGGVLIHPRTGLSRRVGYLTAEFFRLVRLVVDEAARLDMKIVLYDEGSYPSGSAQGRVVAEDPTYAQRCLITRQTTIHGPASGFWHPNPGRALNDELLCAVMGRVTASDTLDPNTLTLLELQEPELVRYTVLEGEWRLVALWHVYSGGTIRGVFAEEEDQQATAPPAGDILNPAAVASFLRHTHDQYYAHLKDHFGSTIVALFTDEPMVLGRGVRRGPEPWPFTPGFLDDLQTGWDDDVRRWLPALWLACGPRTDAFRQVYTRTVYERLGRVFYAAQSRWCKQYGIALTGHPAESNEFGALRHFHWPGQDMVWRWVTPGSESALSGPHSCAPKCASSAAAIQGSRRNATEPLGAYGWQLTLDEAKWLLDWHLVRGANLFFLHACFYSIRGRRAYESEPDLGVHNVWWPYFHLLGDYLRRLCWLLSDGRIVCDVAILTDGNHAAWSAAKPLFQQQIDFLYVDQSALERATVADGHLCIGDGRFRAVVCDPPGAPTSAVLDQFVANGGLVLTDWQPETLCATLTAALGRDVDWPHAPDLRVLHYEKAGWDFYLLVNEGEETITGTLSLAATGALERWEPLTGATQPWPATLQAGRTNTQLRLERRQSALLAVNPASQPDATAPSPPQPGEILQILDGPWQVLTEDGSPLDLPGPGDWAQVPSWETFSGRLRFRTVFTLSPDQTQSPLFLDLGAVGDIAELFLNGEPVGVCAWSPYIWEIGRFCRAGENRLEVWITNSTANQLEGLQRPAGLLGPVVLRGSSVAEK